MADKAYRPVRLPSSTDERSADPSLPTSSSARPQLWRRLGVLVAIAFSYAIAGRFGLALFELTDHVSVVWPASGIAVAAGLIWGPRAAIPVAFGSVLSDIHFGTTIFLALPVALVNSLEALLPALLVRRIPSFDRRLLRLGDLPWFTIIVLASALVTGVLGAAASHAVLIGSATGYGKTVLAWAFSAAAGAILISPLILLFAQRPWAAWSAREQGRGLILLAAIAVAAYGAFVVADFAFPFPLLLPLLLLAVVRYEALGASAAVLVVTAVAVAAVVWNRGYIQGDVTGHVMELQLSLVALQITFLAFGSALAERRRSQKEYLAVERGFQDYFDQLPVGAYRTTSDGTVIEANAATARIFGFDTAADMFESNSGDFYVRPKDRLEMLERLKSQSAVEGIELEMKRVDGDIVWVRMTAHAVYGEDGSLEFMEGVLQDVTSAHGLERGLKANEEKFRLLFVSNPLPMWVYDLDTLRFLAVNPAAVEKYGYSESDFKEMTLGDIRPEEDLPALLTDVATRKTGFQQAGTWRHRTKDGVILQVDISSHTLEFEGRAAALVVAFDVTERNRLADEREFLEASLRQAQKMDAVGRLAGGIAHDFNNILSVILNYAEFAREDMKLDDNRRSDIDEIIKAGDRAANLVRGLLAFSRKEVIQPRVMELNNVVSDLDDLLSRSLGEHIELVFDTEPELPHVKADRSELEQVIVNLAVNARDAMPEGGALLISTRMLTVAAGLRPGLPAGSYVRLCVSDTGAGMDELTKEQVFEPFFTTKPRGEGTGLGLATVYGNVKQMEGWIYVDSEIGVGTTFSIYLPTHHEEIDPVGEAQEPGNLTGTEHILLVEDNDAVRAVARRILTKHGYEVTEFSNGNEALEFYRGNIDGIDLLLTDVVMPQMSGKALSEAAKSLDGDLQTLFMSGYTDAVIAERGVLSSSEHLITKPFTEESLLARVRSLLDGRDIS